MFLDDDAPNAVLDRDDQNNAANSVAESLCVTKSVTSMETVKFIHKWTIDQFSVQQELASVGDSIESNPFGTLNGLYRFRMRLFPCGKDDECRGHLSLFLQIQKCPTQKMRFRVNFYIDTTDGPRGCALNRNIVTINKGGIVTASKFFSIETLKGRSSRFLPDDTLTVGVELTVFGEQTSRDSVLDPLADRAPVPPEQWPEFQPPDRESLGCAYYKLLKEDDRPFTDVTLVCEGREFHAHRVILCSRSDVFRAMLLGDTREGQDRKATLEDVTPDAVEAMLEYVYTDRCTAVPQRAVEILRAADKYCLEGLKSMCERYLLETCQESNACDMLRCADAYTANKLRQRAFDIIRKSKDTVLKSPEWTHLENECPKLAAQTLKELVCTPPVDPQTLLNQSHNSSRRSDVGHGANGPPSAKRPRM